MKLLTPGYPPLRFPDLLSWSDQFHEQLSGCEVARVISGYASELALRELDELLLQSSKNFPKLKHFDLVIGMAYFEGLTARQKSALEKLHTTLSISGLGSVYIPLFMKVHSKCSVFRGEGGSSALLGSTNLSALIAQRQSELDLQIGEEHPQFGQILDYVDRVLSFSSRADSKILEAIPTVRAEGSRLPSTQGVFSVPPALAPVAQSSPKVSFDLPLKTELKSNLNKFNAAPRGSIPRSWWEIELIVPSSVQRDENFPSKSNGTNDFFVFTDDGYSFRCHVSGGSKPRSNKNFESSGDLDILGLWLKGRLIEAGCLEEGEFVTDETLSSYGRRTVSLTKLAEPNSWAIDFSRSK